MGSNVYGSPPPVIPLNVAAAHLAVSVASLIASLAGNGKQPVIVTAQKRGVKPADLDEISAGASTVLAASIVQSPATDQRVRSNESWG